MLRKKFLFPLLILVISLSILRLDPVKALTTSERLAGRILLQVEEHGEAWYVSPDNNMRYFLGRPTDAFNLMREQGVGITNSDLARIPVDLSLVAGADSDKDGLPDLLENSLSTNNQMADTDHDGYSDKDELLSQYSPIGAGRLPIDLNFSSRQAGKILLQVEAHGEAWYINPLNNKRYFLGRPLDAFNLMRALGLGITNSNLEEIIARVPNFNLTLLSEMLYNRINSERTQKGLNALAWNSDLAAVASEHSENLRRENESTTDMEKSCDFPIIHHEGFDFGAYNKNRLNNRDLYYFSDSGENIALVSGGEIKILSSSFKTGQEEIIRCENLRKSLEEDFSKRLGQAESESENLAVVREEIAKRITALNSEAEIRISSLAWQSLDDIAAVTVSGWMDSLGHRQNILNPEFNESGIGLAFINGYIISTQVFIKHVDCGFYNGPCCEEEGYYPYCYEPYSCSANICQ